MQSVRVLKHNTVKTLGSGSKLHTFWTLVLHGGECLASDFLPIQWHWLGWQGGAKKNSCLWWESKSPVIHPVISHFANWALLAYGKIEGSCMKWIHAGEIMFLYLYMCFTFRTTELISVTFSVQVYSKSCQKNFILAQYNHILFETWISCFSQKITPHTRHWHMT